MSDGTVRATRGRTVLLSDGRAIGADRVVLALGHGAPTDPSAVTPAVRTHPHYVGNPWIPGALDRVPGDVPVLLIGTGLTAVDVALALHGRGRRAPVLAVSRRGLLPLPHLVYRPLPTAEFAYHGSDASGLLRRDRHRARRRRPGPADRPGG